MFDGIDPFDDPSDPHPPPHDDLAGAVGTGIAVALVAGCLWVAWVAWHVAIAVGLP